MNSPIFVVGTPRSGTTLTARILGNHSRIFMPGETHFFDDIYSRRDEIGPLNNNSAINVIFDRLSTIYRRYNEPEDQQRITSLFKKKEIITDFKSNCRTYKDVYSWFLEKQMRLENKVRWGNQVPRDIFNVKEILEFYPNAKFVVCIRDIKDFLVSYKNKWKTADYVKNLNRLRRLYHPVVTSILWKTSVKRIEDLMHRVREKDRIIVQYENLVRAPQRTVSMICDCIEEKYEDDMLSTSFSNSSFSEAKQGIFQTSIGRWKASLAPEEIAVAQMIASRELLKYGYHKLFVNYRMLKLLGIWTTAPFALARAFHVNRELRGSLVQYILKRIHGFI